MHAMPDTALRETDQFLSKNSPVRPLVSALVIVRHEATQQFQN